MKASGLRPNRDIAFHITQACFECARPDLAVAYCREFEANGLPPRPIVAKRVQEAEAQLRGKAARVSIHCAYSQRLHATGGVPLLHCHHVGLPQGMT